MKSANSGFKLSYLYVFIVFCLTFNAVKYWPLFGIMSICYGIGIMLPFIICTGFFNTRMNKFFVFYAFVVLINHLLGDVYLSNRNSLLIGFVGFFVSMSMSYYIFTKGDYNLMRAIILTVLIVLLLNTIATAYFNFFIPGLVRYAYGVSQLGDKDFNSLYALGLSSYALPHAVPILIPPLVLGIKNSSLKTSQRIFTAIILVCCIMLVYFSGAVGPLLVALVILIMSFVIRRGSVRSNIVIIFLGFMMAVLFILSDNLMLNALGMFDDFIGREGYFHNKVVDFENSIIYGSASGDVENRGILYRTTINAIFEHPLFGAQDGLGGHSALMDRFAALGLVGFIPFVAMLVSQISYVLKNLPSQIHIYYYMSLVAALVMLISKNIAGWSMWFFLFAALPFLLVYYSDANICDG